MKYPLDHMIWDHHDGVNGLMWQLVQVQDFILSTHSVSVCNVSACTVCVRMHRVRMYEVNSVQPDCKVTGVAK